MTRDSDALQIEKWAASGDVATPESQGLTRASGWPVAYSQAGSGKTPERDVVNQLLRELTALAVELNTTGLLEWDSSVSYVHPAIVMGSNGRPYLSKRDNQGVDPTGTAPESDWQGLPITDTRTAILDPIAAVLPTGQFDQGAERVFVESAAKRFWYELRFDDTTNEYAMWHLTLPAIATSLELKFTIKWKAAATTGDVRWAVEVLAVGDDDVWDAVTGQQTLVTDSAKSTAEDVNKAELTAIVPTGGTAGDILKILLYRNASDTTNDTMTGDAKTVGVNVQMSPST